jgi:hypothetical protein
MGRGDPSIEQALQARFISVGLQFSGGLPLRSSFSNSGWVSDSVCGVNTLALEGCQSRASR